MTAEEIRAFLTEKPRTGKIATVRPDGRPHVVPIWFALDGDAIVFTTWHATVKAANLRHNRQVCLCVDEETPPFTFVMVEGSADINETPDPEERLHWATTIAGRYMGADRAEEYGERNGVEGEWLVRITPTNIVARKNVAD